ncbi:MAG: hypothetical protein RMK89_10545 [Armatimonadota bacterium]|nr:hypothetical protein [Armatimonadota bacterium]MDW8143888.1 hypothetical protein [Armatimonadota bacterium]
MSQDILLKRLKPFRRRVRWVLAWRYTAVGGAVGAALALLTDLGDWLGKWEADPVVLVLTIALGLSIGVAYAFLRSLPSEAIAKLIDRRAELKDRIATALLCDESPFVEPLREDALTHLASVRPAQIFRFRLTAWHGVVAFLLVTLMVSRFLPHLPLPFLASFRQDRKEAKQVVENLQRVLKPIVEHAKEPEATKLEKAIAQQLRELYKRSQQGRLSKKEALIKAEKLLADAEKLQRQSQEHLRKVSTKAITAAETLKESLKQKAVASQMKEMRALLERMQEIERQLRSQNLTPTQRRLLETEKQLLQRTLSAMGQLDRKEIQRLMEALQQQQAQLQNMLQSSQLSAGERQLIQQQLQSIQQQLRALQLSKQAQEFLRKLMGDPNFQEAMKLLAELQKQLQQMQMGQIPQLSPEELEQMLKELEKAIEELAKQFGDDEKIRELAKQILEAVKRLKEGGT